MKTLYLFVGNFSSSKSEEFFEEELPYLKKYFDRIILVPLYNNNSELRVHNDLIEILHFDAFSGFNRVKLLSGNLMLVLKIFVYEFYHTHHKWHYLINFRRLINEILFRINAAIKFEEHINKNENVFLYSYWFNQWAFIISLLKLFNPKFKTFTRAHGSDYKEEQTGKVLNFRYFQLKHIDKVVCVSEYAANYLNKKFKLPINNRENAVPY